MFQVTNSNTPIQTLDTSLVILEHVSLADKNTFGTGGLARFYCRPQSAETFAQALSFAREKNLEIFVLGGGANILISDQGFSGLVIHPNLQNFEIIESTNQNDSATVFVQAGAGISIENLINLCLRQHILGLEEFSGIPGTVGGAVYINLHYYEFLLEQFLVSATLIHRVTGQIITVDTAWFNFGYDQSKLQEKEYFVVDATFKLTKSDAMMTAFAQGRSVEITRHRQKRYPYQNTCGSFFRNFHPEEVVNTPKKLIYVAYYLDQLGVKGELSVGGAVVSHQHANMIVCKNGTSSDIVNLTLKMQQMVYETYNIKPQPECQLVGFDINPFL
ncbi:UDP-N-acetylmuramate dehydrogenase [Candidatus Babeliales bacterium]|nr:UDP-N-acetylmuramate dehydrogenase [Candidatus Babeliales bacterium]MBP9843337.1 UDP-N-acetylmuramate dehydrogenase [Candidatus Babeliales bacterium]